MVRKFAELRTNMTPEAQARSAAMAEGMLVEMQFRDLRKSRHFTQVEVAQALSVDETAVPKLEHREDMFVSTLRDYIKALGGDLHMVASFPDAENRVQPFRKA